MASTSVSFVQSEAESRKTASNGKILCTFPTECGYSMLMSIPIEARRGHEQPRNTPTRHAARLSGGVGLVCRTPRLDPTAPGCVPQAKALSSQASDHGAGISRGHPGRAAALAGY